MYDFHMKYIFQNEHVWVYNENIVLKTNMHDSNMKINDYDDIRFWYENERIWCENIWLWYENFEKLNMRIYYFDM